jgi:hypothetical protein
MSQSNQPHFYIELSSNLPFFSSFFSNKGEVTGMFIVVGLPAAAILFTAITTAVPRRRAKKFDQDVAQAAVETAPTGTTTATAVMTTVTTATQLTAMGRMRNLPCLMVDRLTRRMSQATLDVDLLVLLLISAP